MKQKNMFSNELNRFWEFASNNMSRTMKKDTNKNSTIWSNKCTPVRLYRKKQKLKR
jgi:hypothetical protein